MLMMLDGSGALQKRWRAHAHDADLVLGLQKRWRADAHDAGVVLGPSKTLAC